MHLVVVKSKHGGGAERVQEMQNFLDVYMMLVSNIKYTICIYETVYFFPHTIISK